jgi:hypothetical protein
MSDIVPTRTQYGVRRTLNISEEMDRRFQQLLLKQQRDISLNDLFRMALRQYLDDQEDVIGSRRNFSKSLQNRLDQLENNLLFYLNVLIFLFASCLAVLLQAVTKDSKVQSTALIRTAIATALKEGSILNKQIAAVRQELSEE